MFAHLEIVRIFVGQLTQFLKESIAAVELVLLFRVTECIENAALLLPTVTGVQFFLRQQKPPALRGAFSVVRCPIVWR